MRLIKWIAGGLAVLVVAFVVVGMILPREVTVARSIEIDAPASDVFPHVNSLKAAAAWSPWLGLDPEVKLTYSGPDAGAGAKLEWTSDMRNVGSGVQVITASVPDSQVVTDLDFGDMGTAVAAFNLVEEGGKTRITWDLVSDMGVGPIGRWMGLMMDDWVGADYETGLTNLKTLVEGG